MNGPASHTLARLNSICMREDMYGLNTNFSPALSFAACVKNIMNKVDALYSKSGL